MKRYYRIIFSLSLLISVSTSCVDDYLSVNPKSTTTPEVIFSDETFAEGSVFGIYERITNASFNHRLWPYKGLNNDTEVHLSSHSTNNVDNHISVSTYNNRATDDYWGSATSMAYEAIERANLCIEGLEKYGNPQPGTKLGYLYGEALFLRAWIYFELVGWFGNIPARFVPLSSENLYVGRSDRDDIYKQLLADLAIAAEMMPWAGTTSETANVIRPNKAAAKGLRARIALFAGGYGYHLYGETAVAQLSEDPDLTVEKTYAIARQECLEIMENEGKGFILENDFGKIFKDNCAAKFNAGGECLFKIPYLYAIRGNWMVAAGLIHGGDAGNNAPADGSDPYTTQRMGGIHGVVPSLFYDYEKEDTRRDISVAPFRWANGKQELASVRMVTCGKLRAEWVDLAKGPIHNNVNDGITPIIIRYADVLLMFAEAENQLNGPTEAAIDALNRVRTRAYDGVSQRTYVESRSTDKATFLKAIQDERRLEFVGEMIRKYDLIRWNLLKTNIDKALSDIRALRARSGVYADVPAYVFWKYKTDSPNEREIMFYGFERGEVAPGITEATITNRPELDAWMAANGWRGWNNQGNHTPPPANPRLWINSSETASEIRDSYLTYYLNDPDRQMDCPLPQSIITASQGALSNSELGYR